MRTLTIILLLVVSNLTIAQPIIEWQKSFGGTSGDRAYFLQQTADNGYVVAGYSSSNDGDATGNHGDCDMWIVKITNAGSITWQKSLGGTNIDIAYSIQQTDDGGYIVGGQSTSNNGDVTINHGDYDMWIVKLDSVGAITWQKSFGGTGLDAASSIQQTLDGGYIVIGHTTSNDGDVSGNHGATDMWVLKLTSIGAITWQKLIGGTGIDVSSSVQQTADGGYIVGGQSNSNDGDVTINYGDYDFWIVKLDSVGAITWQKSYGGTGLDGSSTVQQTADGGYIVAGSSKSNDWYVTGNHGYYDFWVVKLNSAGIITWQKSLGGTNSDVAYSIQQTDDGGYIVGGQSTSNDGDVSGNHGDYDFWIVKLTSAGVITWQKSLGGTGVDNAYSIQQTLDGGYVVAGHTTSNDGDVTVNNGYYDFWVVKLSTTVGVNELPISSINIHPNPTSGQINISLEDETLGSLRVLNSLGQVVLEEGFEATRELNISLEEPSGIYFLQVEIDGQMITKKIIKE